MKMKQIKLRKNIKKNTKKNYNDKNFKKFIKLY